MQNLSGLDLDFAERLARLRAAAQEAGMDLDVTSGYRTPERQAELYQRALAKYGSEQAARKWVAPPGRSQHNLGSAADLSYASPDARAWAHENAPAHGLNFPLGNEPWHIEPVGARSGTRQAPVAAAAQDAPAPRANRFLAALETQDAPAQAAPMTQAAQPEKRPNRFLAALEAPTPTQAPAQPAAPAALPDLLGNAQAAQALPAMPPWTPPNMPDFKVGGKTLRQAKSAPEKPGFWGSIGPAFRGNASLSQNLGEAAGLGEAPRGIDPKTGRVVGAPQGLAEQAGQFVGVAGKELVDPISLALAPVGAGMATLPRLATYAGLGGGYEAASSALEQAMSKGSIDPGEVGQRALIGAVAAPAIDVAIRGAAAAIRKLRGLPAQDAARRTAEINATVRQAAEQQGVDPAAAQSELVRLVTDEASGRPIIEPDAQAPARLAGFLPETPDAQAPRLPPPEGQALVAPASGGEPGLPSPGPEGRPVGAGPAPGPAPLELGGPGRGPAPVAPEALPGQGGQVAPQETLTPSRATAATRADEYERLAQAATDAEVRADLLRQANLARAEAQTAAQAPMTQGERLRQARRVDLAQDDMLAVLRKRGGLNMDDPWVGELRGRFSQLPRSGFGLPAIERSGRRAQDALTSDGVVEVLTEHGFIPPGSGWREAEDLLLRASTGERIMAGVPEAVEAQGEMLLERRALSQAAQRFAEREGAPDSQWEFADGPAAGTPEDATLVVSGPDGKDVVVHAQTVTLNDLEKLANEERAAAEARRLDDAQWERELAVERGAAGPEPGRDTGGDPGLGGAQRLQGEGPPGGRPEPVAAVAPEPAAGPGQAAAVAPAEPGQAGLGGAVGGEVGQARPSADDLRAGRVSIYDYLQQHGVDADGYLETPRPDARKAARQATEYGQLIDEIRQTLHRLKDSQEKRMALNFLDEVIEPNFEHPFRNSFAQKLPAIAAKRFAARADQVPTSQNAKVRYDAAVDLQRAEDAIQYVEGQRPPQVAARSAPPTGAEPDLPGIAPRNQGQQDLADLLRQREAARPGAPGPEGFRLAGSDREADQAAAAGQATLFSNPFALAGRAVVRGAAQAPGHALAGGFAGGVGGATTSTEPVGTPGWWRDVGMGAAGGAALGVGLRGAGVTGKGGVLADWYGRLGRAVDKLPGIGRGPDEVIQAKRSQRIMESLQDEQVAKVGVALRDHFSPAERAQMADLIEGKGIVRDFDAIHRQAQALDTYLQGVGRQMQDLGMLGPDVDVDGGYLHRYYSKHLLDDLKGKTPEQQARRQARSQQGLSGSYTIRRGTTDAFERDYLSPAARAHVDVYETTLAESARVQAELNKLNRQAIKSTDGSGPELDMEWYNERSAELRDQLDVLGADLADLRKVKLTSFTGTQNGKPHEFIFATDEVGRVDAGQPPVLAYKDKPGPGLDPRAMPEAPGVEDLAPTGRTWTLDGIGKDGKPNLHRDWTKEERAAWGEIPDAGYRFVRGMAEASHDLSLARMFKTVASRSDFAKAAADAPPEWIRVPDSQARPKSPLKRYGALSGMAVRPDVWNGIKNYGRAPFWDNPAGDLYRSTLSRWKAFKTVYNPVTHLNNVGSNVHLYSMAGYHPKELASALGELRRAETSPLVREARTAGLFTGDWVSSLKDVDGQGKAALNNLAEALRTQPEIPDAVQVVGALTKAKEWWINSSNSLREAKGPLATGAALGKALGDPVLGALKTVGKPVQRAAEAMQRAYRFEDDLFKLAVYRAERAKGTAPKEAVEAAQRYFFDYHDLPEAVKWVRDFPIGAPFVSYTWKALPAVVRTAIEHPELVLATVAGYEALNYAAIAAGEDEPGMGPGEYWATERAEQTLSAPWERGRSAFGARNTLHLPGLEDYTLAMARVYPLGNPFVMESSPKDKALGGAAVPGFWGPDIMGGNPITRLIVDLTEGKDWKGKDLWKPGTPPDEKVRIGLNYIYQAVTPSNPLFPGSYPQQKIIEGLAQDKAQAIEAGEQPNAVVSGIVDTANAVAEALGGEQFTGLDRSGKPVATGEAALQSLGVKVRQFDPEAGFDWEARRPKQAAQDIKAWRKSRGRLAGEGRITEEQLAADEAQAEARLEAGPQAQRARLEAARELLERQGRFSR